MSWTDENYSDPQPPYGQAADNEIGWGQAADNAISWGKGHIMSLGHAVTNLFGNLGSTIYARRFDGINDEIVLPSIMPLEGSSYWVEMQIANFDTSAGNVAGYGNTRLFMIFTAAFQTRLEDSSAINTLFSSFGNVNLPVTDKIVTVRVEKNTTTLTTTYDGVSVDTACNDVDASYQYIGSRNSDLFFAGDIVEITDSLGNTFNEANNWGGGTKYGTTLIQSTDGGVTWTIV